MFTKSKLSYLFSASALVFAFSAFAAAQATPETPKTDGQKAEKMERRGFGKRGGHHGGMRHGGRGMGFLRGIELTDAQKEQIRSIREANKPGQEVMDQMKAIRETRKNGGTITEVQKAQLKELRQAQRAKMKGVHEQIIAVLTPEQKTQLETRRAEMQKRREEFRQKRQELREKRKIEAKPTDNN